MARGSKDAPEPAEAEAEGDGGAEGNAEPTKPVDSARGPASEPTLPGVDKKCSSQDSKQPALGGAPSPAWSETLFLTFAEADVEAAFQSHCSAWILRRGEITSRCAVGVSTLLVLASSTGSGEVAAIQRLSALFDLALFSILAVAFAKAPRRVGTWYAAVMPLGLLHVVAHCSLTPDRLAGALRLASGSLAAGGALRLQPGVWSEASAGMLLVGLVMSAILFAGLSLRVCLLLAHAVVAVHAALAWRYGSLEHTQLAAVCDVPPLAWVCFARSACLYGFALLAFAMRRLDEKDMRSQFVLSLAPPPLAASPDAAATAATAATGTAAEQEDVGTPQACKELNEMLISSLSKGSSEGTKEGKEQAAAAGKDKQQQDTAKRVLTVPHPPMSTGEDPAGVAGAGSDSPEALVAQAVPNERLVQAMKSKRADWERINLMAMMVKKPGYSLREFFDDCVSSFPELQLFFPQEAHVAEGKKASSGVSNEAEYQRTIGALFAVYWLLRLPHDGRVGFCYGVDANWQACKPKRVGNQTRTFRRTGSPEVLKGPCPETGSDTSCTTKSTVNLEQGVTFQMMTEAQKRASFYETMTWSLFEDLITQAGCQSSEPGSHERIMALLCLTACHDIMKVEDLLPVVQPEHAPYLGYEAGVVIRDHDIALSYVLQHFPNLLPSFAGLPADAQKAVLFTQGKMNFNHGWFVQAEAPPGAMLTTLKSVLMAGATAADLGLYFLHWFTDLAGAEATPLGGAEKFVLKFPHAVLASFLWSIPFLGKLETMSESAVVEQYLKARWRVLAPETPCPQDSAAIACMRVAIMAQSDESVVDAFRSLPPKDRSILASEMARTGCVDQRYSTSAGVGWGPAFLIYYGPALLQKNVDSPRGLRAALRALAEVTRAARVLWPLNRESEGMVVTILVAELKTQTIDMVVGVAGEKPQGRWALVHHNHREGAVEFQKDSQAAGGVPDDGGAQQRMEVLNLERCFQDDAADEPEEGGQTSSQPSEVDDGYPHCDCDLGTDCSGAELIVEKKSSRRASQLPFAVGDEEYMESTVESGLAASLRQENWLLKDQISALSDEVSRLRSRLLSDMEAPERATRTISEPAPLACSSLEPPLEVPQRACTEMLQPAPDLVARQ